MELAERDLAVRMEGITIRFPGVLALDNVGFDLRAGEVHVLLGENGAGKSTLMKILAGAYQRDEGRITLFGEEVRFHSPKEGMDAGIAVIYQEFNLIPYLSVAENIFLGRQEKRRGLVDWRTMNRRARALTEELGLDLDPRTLVSSLGIAQQQMVEIAKALSLSSKVIIMDEPTAALAEDEIAQLFSAIRRMTQKGISVVYISHRLEEIKQIGDRATVLRDGRFIGTVEIADTPLDQMIRMMVGRELEDKFPKTAVPLGEEALRVEGICTADKLRDCSFAVRKGEILGVAGLMGAGRTELMRALTGADHRTAGKVFVEGRPVEIGRFRDAVRHGIGYLSEDRKRDGLVLNLDVQSNITIVDLDKVKRGPFISYRREAGVARGHVERLRIKTPGLTQKVRYLSGGNQQKVVLAKWLYADCKILIFDEPTRGIDVGAKVEIYQLMSQLVERGVAIIMVTSEMPELLGMSDRVLVMHEGRIAGELDRSEATQEKALTMATGGK